MRALHSRLLLLPSSPALAAAAAAATAAARQQLCVLHRRQPGRTAAHALLGSSSTNSSNSSSSSAASEHVTRQVLGQAAALLSLGVPPAGLRAFSTAAAAAAAGSSDGSNDSASLVTSQRATVTPVSGELAELLSDALLGLGAQSVVVEEARAEGQAEQQRFGADAELWDDCRLLVHFALEHDVAATMQAAREICELPDLTYEVEHVVDEEWVAQIKASYVPVEVAPGLWIVPEADEPVEPAAINVRLVPGVAFGTGEHPTTKLCLRGLVALRSELQGAAVLDYGTGSGVLALAALLLGAARAVGTDTDPLAVRAAGANAALNGLQQQLRLVQVGASLSDPDPLQQQQQQQHVEQQQSDQQGGGPPDRTFNFVVANILRGPLLELQPRLTAYCRPGGRLLLSGILQEQVPDVQAAYAPHFSDFQVATEGSWALITAVRRPAA